jgi:hypothetical protein
MCYDARSILEVIPKKGLIQFDTHAAVKLLEINGRNCPIDHEFINKCGNGMKKHVLHTSAIHVYCLLLGFYQTC